MKISTINLNGQSMYQFKYLRIPAVLKRKYELDYVGYCTEKLINLIKYNDYNIVACQELIYKKEYYSYIKSRLEDEGYIIFPDREYFCKNLRIRGNTCCISTFIIKNNIKFSNVKLFSDNDKYSNKFSAIKIKDITLINVHVTEKETKKICLNLFKHKEFNEKENILLVGDFNAAKYIQTNRDYKDNTEKYLVDNEEFLNEIESNGFVEIGKNKDYTYETNRNKNKIDHVYFSNGLIKNLDLNKNELEDIVKLNTDVFYINEANGFTDHNMLEFEVNI